jgi:predicted molibdopterin-dependent oxidoreductase YjgC
LIHLSIDGRAVTVAPGTKIKAAAEMLGIQIPNLCFDPDLSLESGCRLCIVEIKGRDHLVTSCTTDCEENMAVVTENERLTRDRTIILELLKARHRFDCETCIKSGECHLEQLFERYDVVDSRFDDQENRHLSISDPNPFIVRDYDRCILCGKCVKMCDEIVGAKAITISGRGHQAHISVPFDGLLKQSTCIYCGQCIMVCPSGALRSRYETIARKASEIRRVNTTCAFCSIGCNTDISVQDGVVAGVSSHRDSRKATVNNGMLCSKGRFGWTSALDDSRLRSPMVRSGGKLKTSSWERAYDYIAEHIVAILDQHGPEALAMFCSSRLTNEENYLGQKLMRAGIGSSLVHQCSKQYDLYGTEALRTSLGMGTMTNPLSDLRDQARTIFLLGANISMKHPVIGFELLHNLRYHGAKLIVAHTRNMDIVDKADVFLKYRPDTEMELLQGMQHVLWRDGLLAKEFIRRHTQGFAELELALAAIDLNAISAVTEVPVELIEQAAHLYAENTPAMICHGVSAIEGPSGTPIVHQLCNLALLTGNIGHSGAGLAFIREQNNVQGSCDMGGIGRYYPGYQSAEIPEIHDRFSRLWGVDKLPASDERHSLFLTLEKIRDEQIRGLYVLGSNPVKRNPGLINVREAFGKLDFLLVQDLLMSETAELAHVVLPGASYAETDGTYTSTERRVQRVKKAIEPMGNAKADWQIIAEISNRLGYPMHYHNTYEIFEEIRQANPDYAGITYERLEQEGAIFWPCPDENHPGTPILFTEGFPLPGGARFHLS